MKTVFKVVYICCYLEGAVSIAVEGFGLDVSVLRLAFEGWRHLGVLADSVLGI